MNKTKKRAHKRAQARAGFKYPFPLTAEHKIKNLKAVRLYFGLRLGDAKAKLEEDMAAKRPSRRPRRPISELLI